MQHYVCPECGGVSESPKSCDTVGCSLQNQPLIACNCEDGSHFDIQKTKADTELN